MIKGRPKPTQKSPKGKGKKKAYDIELAHGTNNYSHAFVWFLTFATNYYHRGWELSTKQKTLIFKASLPSKYKKIGENITNIEYEPKKILARKFAWKIYQPYSLSWVSKKKAQVREQLNHLPQWSP